MIVGFYKEFGKRGLVFVAICFLVLFIVFSSGLGGPR